MKVILLFIFFKILPIKTQTRLNFFHSFQSKCNPTSSFHLFHHFWSKNFSPPSQTQPYFGKVELTPPCLSPACFMKVGGYIGFTGTYRVYYKNLRKFQYCLQLWRYMAAWSKPLRFFLNISIIRSITMPNLVFYLLVSKNKTNKQINKKTPKKQKQKQKRTKKLK